MADAKRPGQKSSLVRSRVGPGIASVIPDLRKRRGHYTNPNPFEQDRFSRAPQYACPASTGS